MYAYNDAEAILLRKSIWGGFTGPTNDLFKENLILIFVQKPTRNPIGFCFLINSMLF